MEQEAVVEIPRFGFVKRRPDGSIDIASPIPSPFNYGSIPGTISPDGDPLDAIILGRRLPAGTRVKRAVVGAVLFIDAGAEDPKLILSDRPLGRWLKLQIDGFFFLYVILKSVLNRLRGLGGPTAYGGWEAPETAIQRAQWLTTPTSTEASSASSSVSRSS